MPPLGIDPHRALGLENRRQATALRDEPPARGVQSRVDTPVLHRPALPAREAAQVEVGHREGAARDDLRLQARVADRLGQELDGARQTLDDPHALSEDRLTALLRLGDNELEDRNRPRDPSFHRGVISTSEDISTSSDLPSSSLSSISSGLSSPPISSSPPVESPPVESPPPVSGDGGGGGSGGDGGGGDPFMLDLNHDGRIGVTGNGTAQHRDFRDINPTVRFDLDGDGKRENVEWSNGDGDGLLVDDRDGGATAAMHGSHSIDGTRLFGDEGGKHANGYEKLAAHDTNHDGKLTGSELRGLKIWVDDGDARLEEGELKTLAELHVTELSVRMNLVANERGETLMRSTFVQDGKEHMTEDVWFGIERQAGVGSQFQAELARANTMLPASSRSELRRQIDCAMDDLEPIRSGLWRRVGNQELTERAREERASTLNALLRI